MSFAKNVGEVRNRKPRRCPLLTSRLWIWLFISGNDPSGHSPTVSIHNCVRMIHDQQYLEVQIRQGLQLANNSILQPDFSSDDENDSSSSSEEEDHLSLQLYQSFQEGIKNVRILLDNTKVCQSYSLN